MLKITIDGEGNREKAICNTLKEASFELSMRSYQTEGYNKTWVILEKDGKEILRCRLDLTINDRCKNFKTILFEDIERDLTYCNKQLEILNSKSYNSAEDKKKFEDYIKECEKVKLILEAMDNKGDLKTLYEYSFMHKGKKVWSYRLDELQEDKYTETTMKILSGEVKGCGDPIPNCKKEDIIVLIKELQVSL